MYFIYVAFLYIISLLKCFSKRDKELIEELKKQEFSVTCFRKGGLESKYYNIILRISGDRTLDYDKSQKSDNFNDYSDTFLGINQEKEVTEFINHLKRNKNYNYYVTFYCHNKKEIQFVKEFKRRLELENVEQVDLMYCYDRVYVSFHSLPFFFVECSENSIIINYTSINAQGWFHHKRIVSKEYINDLMSDYFNLYFEGLSNPRIENLLKKYIFNYKLLLIDIKSLLDSANLLEKHDIKNIKCYEIENLKFKRRKLDKNDHLFGSNLRRFHIFFYFLKNTDILKDIVEYSLNNCGSDNYFSFKKILRSLKMDFVDGYEISYKKTGKVIIPFIKYINRDLINDICNKINLLRIEDNIDGYIRLLNYIYSYIRKTEYIEVDELTEIVEEMVCESNLKEMNLRLFTKLLQYSSIAFRNANRFFFLELYHERIKVHFEPIFHKDLITYIYD